MRTFDPRAEDPSPSVITAQELTPELLAPKVAAVLHPILINIYIQDHSHRLLSTYHISDGVSVHKEPNPLLPVKNYFLVLHPPPFNDTNNILFSLQHLDSLLSWPTPKQGPDARSFDICLGFPRLSQASQHECTL